MGIKIFTVICWVNLLVLSASAQCPDKAELLQRMYYLRDSSKHPYKEQLSELLPFVERLNACADKNDSVTAFVFRRIGGLYYLEKEYLKSLDYYRQFINIVEKKTGTASADIKNLPGGYYWLSTIYDSLHMIKEKWKAIDNCTNVAERIGTIDRSNLFSLYKRMVYFVDVGDYYRCINYARRCETLGRSYAKASSGEEIATGLEYVFLSSLLRAQALLVIGEHAAAEKLLANKVVECRKTGFTKYLGIIYEQLANVQKNKGNYASAYRYLINASKFYKDTELPVSYKRILNAIGSDIFYNHLQNYDSALYFYNKALTIRHEDQSQFKEYAFETLSILGNIANVYVKKNHYDSAFYFFQRALSQLSPGINESGIIQGSAEDFFGQEKIYYRVNLLIDKSNAYRQLYQERRQPDAIKIALENYKAADQLLDRIKSGLTEFQSKLFWRKYSKRLYENAIEACYISNDATNAFYFFEKSRAVLVYDLLNEQRWLSETDILKQTELQKKIVQTERELVNSNNSVKKMDGLERDLFIKKHELDLLQQQIKTSNPLYYQNFLDTGIITIGEVTKKLLGEQQALMELFAGDSAVYSLVIASNNPHLNRISKKDFDSLTALFIRYISNSSLQNKNYSEFLSISSKLYQLIFSNQSLEHGRIIISPDGQYFPFEALVIRRQPVTYLLHNFAISYTYSARYLMNHFVNAEGDGSQNFMGIAPVQYPADMKLASLGGSDLSLQKLKSYFRNADNLTTTAATRENFLNNYYRYRVIQLYTHSSDSSEQGEPVIYFADSALYLSDLIGNHKPSTSLIVLSACETGKGKVYQGEGLFSFNRGFAALGIPTAISNLWSVDNESTYILTELFYKWLAKGLPTDIALQKAKLEFFQTASQEKSLPFYWAAPVLVGKAEIIEISKPYPWKWMAGSVLVVLVVAWMIRKRTSSRKKSVGKIF